MDKLTTKRILLVAFILLVHFCKAQTAFGLKGGLNIGSFTGPGVVDGASSLTAGNIGIFENTPLSKSESLAVEMSVSWEGENFNSTLRQSMGSFKYTYLNIPVLFRKNIVAGLFAETGPQFGLMLSAKSIITGTAFYNGTNQPTVTSDFSGNVNSLNFGWDFGLGYQVSKMFAVGARYNLGLTNLGSNSGAASYKNSVFSFNLFISPLHSNFIKNKNK